MSTTHTDTTIQTIQSQPPPSLWRNRNFLFLITGQAISSAGTQISQLAFPLLVLALTHSPAQTGLISAMRGLSYALLTLPAGALVDRWNRKRVMILSNIGSALTLGSIPIALLFGHLTLLQLYLVSFVDGLCFVFFNMAESAAIPHVVAKEQIPAANGQNEVLYASATMFGPAIGGILYSLSAMLPFISDSISYLVSLFSLLFIKTEFQHEQTQSKQHMLEDIKDGLRWLWEHPVIRFLAIMTLGLMAPCAGYSLILIVMAHNQHASNAAIGLIFAGGGVGNIIGAAMASWLERRFGFTRVMVWSTWVWCLTWLFYAFAPNPFVLSIVNGLSFTVVPIYMVVQYSYRQIVIPDHLRGRVNSVFRLIAFGAQPLGMAVTGILLQAYGPAITVIVLFVPQVLLAILVVFNKPLRQVGFLHTLPTG